MKVKTLKITVVFIAIMLQWLISCAPSKSIKDDRNNASDSPIDPTSEQNGGSEPSVNSSIPTDDAAEFQVGHEPALVTGINLVGLDNGRVRCDYTQEGIHDFLMHCIAVIAKEDGNEIKADGFKPGVIPTWQDPTIKVGNALTKSCTVTDDKLKQACAISTIDGFAKLQLDLGLKDTQNGRQKTVSTEVLLPYSVGVAAGFVPRLPFIYQEQQATTTKLVESNAAEKLGFQRYWFPSKDLRTTVVSDLCTYKGSAFFMDSHQVFEHKDGKLSLYGGNTNLMINFATAKDRYQVPLGLANNLIACGPEGIYFLETDFAIGILKFDGSVRYLAAYRPEDGTIGDRSILSKLSLAIGLAVDGNGNFFVTSADQAIYRVDGMSGNVTVVAGVPGNVGFNDDGSLAIQSKLSSPTSIAISPNGELVFAETGNGRIRKIDKSGKLTTVLGPNLAFGNTSTIMPGALTYAPNGDLYFFDGDSYSIIKYDHLGVLTHIAGNGQPAAIPEGPVQAATTPLSNVMAIAIDDTGNLFFMFDWEGIAVIDQKGNMSRLIKTLTPVAPPDGKALSQKVGGVKAVTIGDDGMIYFIDSSAGSIHRVDKEGNMTRLAPNRVGAELQSTGNQVIVNSPDGIAVDPTGNLFLMENLPSQRITKITPTGEISVLADFAAGFDFQTLVSVVYGTLAFGQRTGVFVSDVAGQRVWFFDAQDNYTPRLLIGMDVNPWVPIIPGVIFNPAGLSIAQGELYIDDSSTYEISKINQAGSLVTTVFSAFYPGTNTLLPEGYTPNIYAITNSGLAYVIFNDSALLALPPNVPVNWSTYETIPTPFFGNIDATKATSSMCGFGRVDNRVTTQSINGAIQASMSIMCPGRLRAIAVKDTCPAQGGSTTIVFAQTFAWDQYSNIVQVVKPCGS